MDEFATKGFAGARVRDIARRAGVSKDLIAYHFGGKEGLLMAVQQAWLARKDSFVDLGLPHGDNVARYLRDILSDPRPLLLLAWRGLSSQDRLGGPGVPEGTFPSVEHLARRQVRGEINPDLDPAALQLALLGAIAAPVIFPDAARYFFGAEPTGAEFEARYRAGLLQLLSAASRGQAPPRPVGPASDEDGGR